MSEVKLPATKIIRIIPIKTVGEIIPIKIPMLQDTAIEAKLKPKLSAVISSIFSERAEFFTKSKPTPKASERIIAIAVQRNTWI